MLHDKSTLNVLVLHRLGNPRFAPFFLKKHVYSWKEYCPEHNYLFHDTALPLPDYVKDTKFDVIILDVTLLCVRWAGKRSFQQLKDQYNFVRNSNAVKIALPQDEYDCNLLLDEWMCEWNIDIVVSVIKDNHDVLYPKYNKQGKIILGYTGYVDETLLDYPLKPFNQRSIDIGYRAKKLPPYFGKIGETKWLIGEHVEGFALNRGLVVDIVLGDAGTLFGNAWLDFINNSKFTLGSNSGSSLLDPYGDIQKCVHAYLAKNPNATFNEIESRCFPDLDGKYEFTAISPRVLESAMLESCQILVKGTYSGVIEEWEHYIPIDEDASNFDEVVDAMKDNAMVSTMIKRCKETILDNKALRAGHSVRSCLSLAKDMMHDKSTFSNSKIVSENINKYAEGMKAKYRTYYLREYVRKRAINSLKRFPTLYNYALLMRRKL